MIRYKVVTKKRGSCTVPWQSHKYYKKYPTGKIVEMTPDSFGIMVFATRGRAQAFCQNEQKILRVKPEGKALRRPQGLLNLNRMKQGLFTFYECLRKTSKGLQYYAIWDIPQGTLFYRAVKVLD